MDKRNSTRGRIINYMLNHPITSKAELSKELNISMPTVLTNVNELISQKLLTELGEYESTGGRKAKSIGINKSYRRAMGVVISANHLEMVLINLGSEIEKSVRVRLKFSTDFSYCMQVKKEITKFLKGSCAEEELLGVGIAIPGIIDQQNRIVLKSHALQIENYSLRFLEQALELPVYFENDANAAMLAENPQKYQDAIYLSLNHTLGGAFCINGQLFRGKNQKAGEFGCTDAYCAESVLTDDNRISLETFMTQVKNKDAAAGVKWENYLDHLAILISNLRMAYDMDIILGGDVGGVLAEYMIPLGEKVMGYNGFDHDVSYLKNCAYEKEASAVGAARHFFADICH